MGFTHRIETTLSYDQVAEDAAGAQR